MVHTDEELLTIIIKICSMCRHDDALSKLDIGQVRTIAEMSAKNGVAGWLLKRLKEDYSEHYLFEPLKNALQKSVFMAHIQNQNNKSLISEVKKILNDEGIEIVLLKGAAMMTGHYKEVSQRPIGDIDIYVRHEDVYRAHEILKSKGMNPVTDFRTHVLQESIKTHLSPLEYKGQTIEMHYDLYSQDSLHRANVNICDHLEERNGYMMLESSMMLYHLTTHIIKNRKTIGLRVGWLVDLLVLFDEWGEERDRICSKALEYNPSIEMAMRDVWLRIEHMYNGIGKEPDVEYLKSSDEGYKSGIKARLMTIAVLSKAIVKAMKEDMTMSNAKNIIYDINHRRCE